ncbi:MAG: hypothetical protein K2J87_01275 [Muribaculaceae bacterium]|nr:hypothetical protein [Muribaculaceae bacterium]
MKSRKNGHFILFYLKIGVHPELNVEEAEKIASAVEENLRQSFGNNVMINVRTMPSIVD